MLHWAVIVVGLYGLLLVLLTVPVIAIGFLDEMGSIGNLGDVFVVYATVGYWGPFGVLVLSQVLLLVVPVKVASRRPVSRLSLLWPIVTTGFLIGLLAAGGFLSLYEFQVQEKTRDAGWIAAVNIFFLTWIVWACVFFFGARSPERPRHFVARQCRYLFCGSILELLVAVPTHIVARSRDYCCAGVLTFAGLATGLSVMLCAFGPGVFFLYWYRWRRLRRPL